MNDRRYVRVCLRFHGQVCDRWTKHENESNCDAPLRVRHYARLA
jgi:hypothetical protein